MKLIETINEADGEWFVSDHDNRDHFDYYLSKLFEATNNDFNKIVGPSAAFPRQSQIWNDYLSRSELSHVSYHTYGGADSLFDEPGKQMYVTEYGMDNMNLKVVLSDLWRIERMGTLNGGIQKLFYVQLDRAFSETVTEGDHLAIAGWARALAAFQSLASISTRAHLDDGASDFVATDDGNGKFGALLWRGI